MGSKKEIEKELNKELKMNIDEDKKLICRFTNGQELKLFKNVELKIDILVLVIHENYFNGLSGQYEDRTKDFTIKSRKFEGIIDEIIEINKEYFDDRKRVEVGFFTGKTAKTFRG